MMKKFVFIAVVLVCCVQLSAQESETSKTKEYCFSLPFPQNINHITIGFDYKVQLGQSTFLKLSTFDLAFSYSKSNPSSSTNYPTSIISYSGGLGAGLEFRKELTPSFTFFHGPNIGYSYSNMTNATSNPVYDVNHRKMIAQTNNAAFSYTLGFMFKMSNHVFIAAQINPYAGITFYDLNNTMDPGQNYKSTGFDFGFTDNIGSLSIVYRR